MNPLSNLDAISKTGLDKIAISPLDYWWHFLNPNRPVYKPDDSVLFNQALRCAVFTPGEFAKKYVRQPIINKKTNLGKSEFENLLNQVSANGQELLDFNSYDSIVKMQSALTSHPTFKLLMNGEIGKRTRFIEPNSEAVVKFQPDFISNGKIIVDLATIENKNSSDFSKIVANFNLHKKAALQMDGTGLKAYVFVRIEEKEPFKISFHYLDDRSIAYGRELYIDNCHKYASCLKTGVWNGYSEKINEISLPEWAFRK